MANNKLTPLYVLLACFTALLFFFPLKMQPMEPYAYAAAAEGYYNLTTTFALQAPTVKLPDISRFHPNHPLPHFIAAVLYGATGVGAMGVFKALNFAGALLFIVFFYLSALRLVGNRTAIVTASLALVASYVFWAAALSGEMQLFGLALMMAAIYFLIRYLDDAERVPRYLFIAALFYVLAGAFHLFTFILIVPAGFALLVHSRKAGDFRIYALVLLLILAGYSVFYGLILSRVLDIHSLEEYLRTLFIYNQILLKAYTQEEWWPLLTKSLFRAWVYADGLWGFIPKCALTILILVGYWRLAVSKLKTAVKVLLLGWPVLQILVQIAVYGRPEGLNFWLFLFPTFYMGLATAFAWLEEKMNAATVAILVPLLLLAVNFTSAIFPNSNLETGQVLYFKAPKLPRETPAAVVITEPVLTYGEIWTMGSHHGFRNQKVFLPCCGERNVREKLVAWAKSKSTFLIVSDAHDDLVGEELKRQNISFNVLQDDAGEIMPAWVPMSLYLDNPRGSRYSKNLRVYYHAAEK